jgi:hypothetical protein
MSNTDKDKEFYEMADAYIALANKQSKNVNQGKVSATFLYAAARFNTFLVASGSNSANEFASKKENIFDYYMTEYKKMLEEHFADYQNNFEKYLGKKM